MIAYKLFRLRRDGTLGSLFINRKQVIEIGRWYQAESHPTNGYKYRPGWHCTRRPWAPHLTKKGRVWRQVEIQDYEVYQRPRSQGGLWFLAQRMRVIG